MSSRYDNINTTTKKGRGRVYDSTVLPYVEPTDTDIVIITAMGDRLDLLAKQYLNDVSLWWVIALKNNITEVDLTLKEGIVLRIPSLNEALQIQNSIS